MGTAMAESSGRNEPVVTPATGVSESSRAAKLPAPRRRFCQRIRRAVGDAVGPTGQRDVRPLHAEGTGVGGAVIWVVQRGDDVVEQVLYTQPQAVQIMLRRERQVGAVLRAGAIDAVGRRPVATSGTYSRSTHSGEAMRY